MTDFAITHKGDLSFEEISLPEPLKIGIHIGKTEPLKISMVLTNQSSKETPDGALKVLFETMRYQKQVTRLKAVGDRDKIEQAIYIALFTEKGELDREIGSTLSELKHERIDRELIGRVRQAVEKAIEDIAPRALVDVKATEDDTALYNNNLTVSIYEGAEPLNFLV